jgi:nucleoside-diphosphate-sugar epimerase
MTATSTEPLIVVTGAGGFIGGHLVAALRRRGHTRIRAVDIRDPQDWYQRFADVENLQLDLRLREACLETCRGASDVYQLAADMGGMGFIEAHKAECMLSVLINTHMLQAAREHGVKRFFYSSSACAYNVELQRDKHVTPLKESDAYPAMPEDGYGWEKLFSERMCRHFTEDYGLYTRIARFHNVYGPYGTWDGGREKAPAAICRKVITAAEGGEHVIDIWGTGEQTRSFMYIDDCIHGILAIMDSDVTEPLNLGSSELITINQLVTIAERFAGIQLERRYDLGAPKGVNGRNSDNTLIRAKLGWEPALTLETGLRRTYDWIYEEFRARRAGRRVAV